jgi:hypothetical protein
LPKPFASVSSSERSTMVRARAELVRTELARAGDMTARENARQIVRQTARGGGGDPPDHPDDEVALFDA